MRRLSRTAAIPLLAALAAFAVVTTTGSTAATAAGKGSGGSQTITVTAIGKAAGAPDTATISLGVESRGTTAAEAMAQNAERTQSVINGMQFVGVAKRDIQTSGISLYPTFDKNGRIDGYTVSTRMTAKTHDIAKAGVVIDAAAKLAGDDIRIENISLSIEDTGPVVRTARSRAVHAARDHAGQLARAAKVKVGSVHSIVELSNNAQYYPIRNLAALDESAARSEIPVEAGTQELEIRVKVVYTIG